MRGLVHAAFRYGLVGILNSAVGFTVIAAVLQVAPDRPALANATGFAVGFVIGFVMNRGWTFADRRHWTVTLGPYAALVAACYTANLLVVLIAAEFSGLGIYVPQLLGMATYTLLLFCGSHFFVFRRAQA